MPIYFNGYEVPEPPPLNEKLLDCVLKHIEEHPEEHEQDEWIRLGRDQRGDYTECGTVACVAGWACLLSLPPEASYIDFWRNTGTGCSNQSNPNHIKEKARVLLGLTPDEATLLFRSASGTKDQVLSEVKRRVAGIKYQRGLK